MLFTPSEIVRTVTSIFFEVIYPCTYLNLTRIETCHELQLWSQIFGFGQIGAERVKARSKPHVAPAVMTSHGPNERGVSLRHFGD
jgi:hypothetical protein